MIETFDHKPSKGRWEQTIERMSVDWYLNQNPPPGPKMPLSCSREKESIF